MTNLLIVILIKNIRAMFLRYHREAHYNFNNCNTIEKLNIILNPSTTTDRWFSPGTPVSSTNKTDRHDIAEILLNVAFNSITL